jgi:CelD/BcsL family acetyltransferase involved in cellulose biosynthesis
MAPMLQSRGGEAFRTAANKKSLVRHERALAHSGLLRVSHLTAGPETAQHLDEFFQQHIDRWSITSSPSLFLQASWRDFYLKLIENPAHSSWLRFARIEWNGRSVAFHFGFHYRGEFLWYKPSFDIALARSSPGEVLLRQLLLQADQEGADAFDFGLGEEQFKLRFASEVRSVRTWGLYPSEGDG